MSKRRRISSSSYEMNPNISTICNMTPIKEEFPQFDRLCQKPKQECEESDSLQSIEFDNYMGEDCYRFCHKLKDNEKIIEENKRKSWECEMIIKLKMFCKQLNDERHQQQNELTLLKSENENLKRNFNESQELQKKYDLLNTEYLEIKKLFSEKMTNYSKKQEKYYALCEQLNNYKRHKNPEVNEFKDQLEIEKEKLVSTETKQKVLNENNMKLITSLRIDIDKHIENENELKQSIEEWKLKYNKLTEVIESQSKADKSENENKYEKFYESRIGPLKKNKTYWMNKYNQNKRDLMASQFITIRHEEMIRKTSHTILTLVEKNIKEVKPKFNILWKKIDIINSYLQRRYSIQIMSNFKRELHYILFEIVKCLKTRIKNVINKVVENNRTDIEFIYEKAEKISIKRKDGSVQCPDCDRGFESLTSLKIHLTLIHKNRLDSYFGSERKKTKFVGSLDSTEN